MIETTMARDHLNVIFDTRPEKKTARPDGPWRVWLKFEWTNETITVWINHLERFVASGAIVPGAELYPTHGMAEQKGIEAAEKITRDLTYVTATFVVALKEGEAP